MVEGEQVILGNVRYQRVVGVINKDSITIGAFCNAIPNVSERFGPRSKRNSITGARPVSLGDINMKDLKTRKFLFIETRVVWKPSSK